jgi:hypothetical protein
MSPQVENTLFKVPSAIFDESEVFQDMFSVPQEVLIRDGSSEEHPLVLEGYLASEFEQLLRVLLPLYAAILPICLTSSSNSCSSRKVSLPALTSEQWLAVLKLSTIWDLTDARQRAIDNLADLGKTDLILRLIVAKQYNVHDWFVPAINTLAQRSDPLGSDDLARLRVLGDMGEVCELMLKIAAIRESLLPSQEISNGCFTITGSLPICKTHERRIADWTCNPNYNLNVADRASHDFTKRICEVFSCSADGHPISKSD